ncbi:MAG TPA: amidohydrolase family protein, partial [Rubrivivax sp.]|nr:amidohydrolase family protein [Rubrivivax sp.]
MTRLVVRNARLFDSHAGVLRPGTTIVVEGDRVAAVTREPIAVDDAARVIDAGGRAVLPGLIDAHVHVAATSHDLAGLALQPASLIAAQSSQLLRAMLRRGFTTVRDAGGADHGLREAVAQVTFSGPRLVLAGQPVSQPGGHADMRPRGVRGP